MFHYRGRRNFHGVYRLRIILNHFCAPGSLMYFTGINICHIDLGARVYAFEISSSAEKPHSNSLMPGINFPELQRGLESKRSPWPRALPGQIRMLLGTAWGQLPLSLYSWDNAAGKSYVTKGKRKTKPNPSYFEGRGG